MSLVGAVRLRFFEGRGDASSSVPASAELLDSCSTEYSAVDGCGLDTAFSCPAFLLSSRLAPFDCRDFEVWWLLAEGTGGIVTGPNY
jgi:hypothetical protein